MKNVQPEYTVTVTEAQTVVSDWVCATEEFHQYYYQLDRVIKEQSRSALHPATVSLSNPSGRAKVQNLLKLRQYMNDVLTTLLADMSKPVPAQRRSSTPMRPSKPGQLASHTRLLQDINRKLYSELAQFTSNPS